MDERRVRKVTSSLPLDVLEFADDLAKRRSTSRSRVIVEALNNLKREQLRAQMAEGYKELASDNLQEADEAIELASEVVLGDGNLPQITTQQVIKRSQALVRRYVPKGRSLSDELIKDRREEAARD